MRLPADIGTPLGGMEPWPVQLRLFGILSSSSAHLGCDDGRAVLWSSWRGTGGSLNALGGKEWHPEEQKADCSGMPLVQARSFGGTGTISPLRSTTG